MAEALVIRKFKLSDGSYPKLGEIVEGPEDELRHYAMRGFLRITQRDPQDLPPALLAPPAPAPVVEDLAGLDLPPEEAPVAPPPPPVEPVVELAAMIPPENTMKKKARKRPKKGTPVEETPPQ